jgi:ABC-type sugar transport system substrate-binding protein
MISKLIKAWVLVTVQHSIHARVVASRKLQDADESPMADSANASFKYRFAFITKSFGAAFFQQSETGCKDAALAHNVECVYDGPKGSEGLDSALEQVDIMNGYIAGGIDGIALSVSDEDLIRDSIDAAMDAGIPVITFDSDAPSSKRIVYVGTDNDQFGYELGKVLIQLTPMPGTSEDPIGKVVYMTTLPAPNLKQRHHGFQQRMAGWKSNWKEIAESPVDVMGQSDVAIDEMWSLMEKHPDLKAVVGCCGFNMANEDRWMDFAIANPNVTLVNADADDYQIDLARRGYVHGLVAQMPYEMGRISIDTLVELKEGTEHTEDIGTPALQIVRIPLTLGQAVVDEHQLNNLVILAWFLFGIIALLSISFACWSIRRRKHRVVRASQPEFLVLICVGCFIMGSSLIPLTIDDSSSDGDITTDDTQSADIACQAFPWLFSIGFTLTFSALFSKTWRVNRVFHNAQKFRRVKVTARDVILPLACLLTANILVLTIWTILSPMKYVRQPHDGSDAWNRIISTYGVCKSTSGRNGESLPYVILLLIINLSVVVTANVQAYQARSVKTEFAESQYIAITVGFIMQALVIGTPVFALVRDQPPVLFTVMCMVIFAICSATLCFIFLPKIGRWRKSLDEGFESGGAGHSSIPEGDDRGLRVKILKGRYNTSESLGVRQRAKSGSPGKDLSESSSIRLNISSGNAIASIAEEQDECASKNAKRLSPSRVGATSNDTRVTVSTNSAHVVEHSPVNNSDDSSDASLDIPTRTGRSIVTV